MKINKIKKIIASALLICGISLLNITDTKTTSAAEVLPSIFYSTHVQNEGWQESKSDGELAGTEGKGLRLEGISMNISGDSNLKIKYKTHVQSYGWQDWKSDGEVSGTQGKAKRLEGIKIELTGKDADKYDVYYQVHIQHKGWQSWKQNGEMAGTEGKSLRLEGIKIKICKKENLEDNTEKDSNAIDLSNLGQLDYTDTFVAGDRTYVYCKELSDKVWNKINEFRITNGYSALQRNKEIGDDVENVMKLFQQGHFTQAKKGFTNYDYSDVYDGETAIEKINADLITNEILSKYYTIDILKTFQKVDTQGDFRIYISKIYDSLMERNQYYLSVGLEVENNYYPEYMPVYIDD
ncbi:hypothetical protein [Faecalibacillus faecis]|uniref:hypothetical protein n=1 Tax=Faecalibacillus faecis TaxID=1982628 RepID=UPI0038654F85